jgi:acetyl esterase/lipase
MLLLLTSCKATPTMRTTARKRRILCLHGYHGSAAVLRRQAAPLFSELESIAEFVFVDAPSLARGDFGWWHAVDGRYRGWERTRDAITDVFETRRPFDGVFGFSQGAALAGLLAGFDLPFDFVIMVGGFVAKDPDLARRYGRRTMPSLHIMGRSDTIVPIAESRALAERFTDPVIIEHAGGHVIASEPAVRDGVRAFLEADRAPIEVPLWSAAQPAMRVVFPRGRAPAPALIVFRGGGYATNAGSGGGAAEWAAEHGMVGVEVGYRLAFPDNYDDAARAVRLVRANAASWSVDPKRIGVLGFSAGGHLASLLTTQPALRSNPSDAHVDFAVLAYPVISFVAGYEPGGLGGSVENFFARRDVDEPTRRAYSNELHVTDNHPPTFMWTTADDTLVPANHARLFAAACERAKVPIAFTEFPHGPHGMGLALGDASEVGTWTARLLDWLATRGLR